MRYLHMNQVSEGMVLGKPLYGIEAEMLLAENVILKEEYIQRMKELGITGVYIKDEFSEEVEIPEIIKPELKFKTMQTLKRLFVGDQHSEQAYEDLQGMLDEIVEQIMGSRDVQVNLIDLKVYDEYTYFHSMNVALYAVVTGCGLGLSKRDLHLLGLAGALHDIGKKFISKEILNKKGRLTKEEFDEIKKHPLLGYHYIRDKFNIPSKACIGILQHHERFDGKGYPGSKVGEEASLFGRILAVSDVYDALLSKRPYHDPILPSEGLEYILANSGLQFDPKVVRAFSKRVATYPLGTEVKLSNDQRGIVVKNYVDFNLRPRVKIFTNSKTPVYIDLKDDKNARNITIVNVIGIEAAV